MALPSPSRESRLGESALAVACGFSCVRVSGRRGSSPGWWLCVEAAASGFMAGRSFMGWCRCSHFLGGNLVLLVRQGCRLHRRASEEVV
jgi:hypothetical protein